jgi:hypothetical protein
MPAKFSSLKVIVGECEQCNAFWRYEGWDNGRWYKAYISGKKPKLCKRCLNAQKYGEYRYRCDGCRKQVRGQFEDLRKLVNVWGRSFCQDCKISFFGRYDPQNPALIHVLSEMAVKKKGRKRYYDSEEAMRLAQAERRYGHRVRRLSHANLRLHPEILNPNGHQVGPSGVSRAYQLDHIVPISTCWKSSGHSMVRESLSWIRHQARAVGGLAVCEEEESKILKCGTREKSQSALRWRIRYERYRTRLT